MTTGSMMANEGNEPPRPPEARTEGAQTDHRRTFDSFMAITKWGVILISVALILMAIFLA